MRDSRWILLVFPVAAAACTCATVPPPVLVAVDPVEAPDHLDSELAIAGRNFAPEVRADFDDPARSQVDGVFSAVLVSGATSIPLAGVTLVSGEEIQGTLPAGAPVGTYDLEVVDPRGRVARLPAAFAVFEPECLEIQAPCNDGSLCTANDVCLGWRCRGEPVGCAALDQCHVAGACQPATGLCSDPPAEDGTPCQISCPAGDTCQAGACTAAAGGCQNTAPLAHLSVSPGGGTAGATLFTLDASASSDAEDPEGALRFRFDADGDGAWEGGFSTAPVLDHAYGTPGIFTAAVEVRDSAGISGYATVLVVVAAPGDEVRVTTALDEMDAGATPLAPGGTGLSLREAVAWVNAQRAPLTITLAAPLTAGISGARGTLALLASDAAVVSEPGVTLDFGGFGGACIRLDRPGQRLIGLTIVGCTGVFVSVSGQGSQVAQVTVLGAGGTAVGIEGRADVPPAGEPTSLIGPGNDLSGLATAVNLLGSDYAVIRNRLHRNAIGCEVGGRAWLHQNVFARQVTVPGGPGSGVGLLVHTSPGPVEVLHNVFDRNEADGLRSSVVDVLQIRNNLFTWNGGFGVSAQAAGLTLDHDGYFANAAGDVSAGLSPNNALLLDPIYVDGPGGDYRLLPASPAVDAGLPTGLDVNGPGPNLYDGLAPDLGAQESPY